MATYLRNRLPLWRFLLAAALAVSALGGRILPARAQAAQEEVE